MDERYLQANKEAKLSLYMTLCYLIFWIIFAYFSGNELSIWGFPLWFELSCILTPISFIFACYLIVKYFFKDISLETDAQLTSFDE